MPNAIAAMLAALLLTAAPERVQLEPATAAQVLAAVRAAGAEVVVVNVWATWCIPCREEFPALLRLRREYRERGVALLLVSGDLPADTAATRAFLAEQGVDFPTFLKAEKDQAFIDAFDRDWSGALPATFLYDRAGRRLASLLTPLTYETLEREVRAHLPPQAPAGG